MKRFFIFAFLLIGLASIAAAPNKETNQMIVFTDRGQSTTTNFKVDTVAWVSIPGATPITTGCDLVLTDTGDSTDVIRLAGTTQVVNIGGLNVNGISATNVQGDWCGRVYIYGNRR